MPRKRRQEVSEVSCVVKYLMFGFNVLFWKYFTFARCLIACVMFFHCLNSNCNPDVYTPYKLKPTISMAVLLVDGGAMWMVGFLGRLIGTGMCAVGLWAWTEKDTINNIGRLTNVALDPAMLFIITGGVMFIIGFAGCVGALRENTTLLLFFCVCVGLIFVLEVAVGVLAFVYKDWVRDQIESQLNNMVINYRDDPDLQNLVDWVQKDWLKCCGIAGYRNWENNIYFNCSSPGGEACGVPFSCCRPTNEVIENRHCGFDMMKTEHDFDRAIKIYTEGCIPAGEAWFEKNLIPVASVTVGIAVLQILGICFAHNLRSDIKAQMSRWRHR